MFLGHGSGCGCGPLGLRLVHLIFFVQPVVYPPHMRNHLMLAAVALSLTMGCGKSEKAMKAVGEVADWVKSNYKKDKCEDVVKKGSEFANDRGHLLVLFPFEPDDARWKDFDTVGGVGGQCKGMAKAVDDCMLDGHGGISGHFQMVITVCKRQLGLDPKKKWGGRDDE